MQYSPSHAHCAALTLPRLPCLPSLLCRLELKAIENPTVRSLFAQGVRL